MGAVLAYNAVNNPDNVSVGATRRQSSLGDLSASAGQPDGAREQA
jgi:hypothetical protein